MYCLNLVLYMWLQVKHRHLGMYNRLRTLISNPSKKFYVFSNELHRDTFIERQANETANDKNDRAIRTAAKWYKSHLAKHLKGKEKPEVVLVTNDMKNKEKAVNEGILSYTIHDYVKSMKNRPSLLDSLAGPAPNSEEAEPKNSQGKSKFSFPEHLHLSTIQSGIKSGKYEQGIYQGSRENYLEGVVRLNSKDTSSKEERYVLVKGLNNLNRSVHGDLVAVEILPESEWSTPLGVVMKDPEAIQIKRKRTRDERPSENDDDDDDDALGEDMEMKEVKSADKNGKKSSPCKETGRIVGIIKRNWRPYCGTLLPLPHSPMHSTNRHLFVAADRTIPHIRLETRQADALFRKRIIVSIDSWPRSSRYPQGHFVRVLGDIGDKETENEVLLIEHDVPHQSFAKSVLDDLPQMPWGITADDVQVRTDLRHLDICSVDPPGCTDIDDALHCRTLENGNFEVGVHIADVSHFIRPVTSLDSEAENRGTTVYLADRRIDMVPELLSSNLCSLRGGEERLAFSVLWEMTKNADIVSVNFCKSIIKSRAALTYAEAQMRIDNSSLTDSVTVSLRALNALAKVLRKGRLDNGALTLASPEIRFEVDSETHDPIDLQTKELRDTNSLVEEFMLLANISVAKKIYEEFPHCALLRRHPSPPLSNYDILIKAGACKGMKISVESAKALATSLDEAIMENEPYFNTMLRIMATRCMMQAVYFCSGTLPYDQFHHYGLATPIYTHFTSPIRRYSDIIVHRLLAVIINRDSTYQELLDKEKAQKLCNHLNHRHKNAQYAARASINLHTHLFFKTKATIEEAFVLFVKKNALQILVPKYGLESTMFFDSDQPDSLTIVADVEEPSLTVDGVKFSLFDKLKVAMYVEQSNIQQFKLKLSVVHPKIPGVSVDPDDIHSLGVQSGMKRKSFESKNLPPSKKQKLL